MDSEFYVQNNLISDTIILAVIGGVVTIATTLITAIFYKMNKMNNKVDEYHSEVNGRMGELLDTTKAQGKAEEKNEHGKKV